MIGNFTLGGYCADGNIVNGGAHQIEQQRYFIQQIINAEDQNTQVMNSSVLRFNISGNVEEADDA